MLVCTCTRTTRCREAWALRDRLRLMPVDGSEHTRLARLALARAYTNHLAAVLIASPYQSLSWPMWDDQAWGGPPQHPEEATV
jgi:hypothetical protein